MPILTRFGDVFINFLESNAWFFPLWWPPHSSLLLHWACTLIMYVDHFETFCHGVVLAFYVPLSVLLLLKWPLLVQASCFLATVLDKPRIAGFLLSRIWTLCGWFVCYKKCWLAYYSFVPFISTARNIWNVFDWCRWSNIGWRHHLIHHIMLWPSNTQNSDVFIY